MGMKAKSVQIWRSRRGAVIASLIVLLAAGGAGLFLWSPHGPGNGAGAASEQSAVIQAGPFTSTLSVTGVVTPGDVVNVVAPFDGKVTGVSFDYGAPVAKGQVLVVIDTSDVQQRRNEAEAEFLKSSQTTADMENWQNGPEVSQARRAEATAAYDLADTRRKVEETKALLDRGLVARDEYDGLLQQQRNQEASLVAAKQDLAEAVKRGSGSNRRITELEFANAKARLADLDAQVAAARVKAPVSGVIVRPQNDKSEVANSSLHAGMTLSRGQLIGAIAPSGGLAVAFQLSEADANRVHPGQSVEVTGPGFQGLSLEGVISMVAREATPGTGGAGNGAVTFAATARLNDVDAQAASVIRIGMSANVTIELYTNPSALSAPPGAIQGAAPDTFVMLKRPNGERRRTPVRIGQIAADAVEVLSGLKPGDVVIWSPGPAQGPDAE